MLLPGRTRRNTDRHRLGPRLSPSRDKGRGWPRRLAFGLGLAALTIGIALAMHGCEGSGQGPGLGGSGGSDAAANRDRGPAKGPPVETIDGSPTLRVRIARDQDELTITGTSGASGSEMAGGAVRVGPPGEGWAERQRRLATPLRIQREAGAFLLHPVSGEGLRWRVRSLRLETVDSGELRYDQGRYPGPFFAIARATESGPSRARFDLVNHVPLEQYLPGVLAKELYPDWSPAAFRAQAVAARSYALFEAYQNRRRYFDLTSTTASQVYGGRTTNPRATRAVATTRGRVMAYRGRVLPTYYSSTCGGVSQTAAIAFDDGWRVAPLTGRSGRTWCRASTKYRWGPIRRRVSDLAWRINQWGDANDHAVGALEGLGAVRVSQRNNGGRPAIFSLTDRRGRRYQMRCESFRFACNYDAGRLADLAESKRLLSSFVRVAVDGEQVRFYDGRGFGHGVGLCQWGAQGMAQRGYDYQAILRQYYPGAQLRSLY